MTRPLRWAVLGATSYVATKAVLPALARSPTAELVALASRDPESAKGLADRFGAVRSYSRYDQALSDPDVEAVYIPLPNRMHHEWTLRAAAAGKHVLCEKPLACSGAQAREMVVACESAGVLLMEAYMTPFHPRCAALHDLMAEGALGEFRSGWSCFSFELTDQTNHRWVDVAGGGALLDLGVYCLEPLLRAAGRIPTEVAARAVTTPSGVDISLAGWLDFGRGATGSIFASFQAPENQSLELVGTEAAVSLQRAFAAAPDEYQGVVRGRGGRIEAIAAPDGDPYLGMVEHFEAVVRGRTDLVRKPQRSVEVLEVMDRLRRAATR